MGPLIDERPLAERLAEAQALSDLARAFRRIVGCERGGWDPRAHARPARHFIKFLGSDVALALLAETATWAQATAPSPEAVFDHWAARCRAELHARREVRAGS